MAHNLQNFASSDGSKDPNTNNNNTHYDCTMAVNSTEHHANALECFGFNTTTVHFLIGHGFDTAVATASVTFKELQIFLKHYRPKEMTSSVPTPANTEDESEVEEAFNDADNEDPPPPPLPTRRPPPILFAFITVTRFSVYHQWCYYKICHGQTPDAWEFCGDTMLKWIR